LFILDEPLPFGRVAVKTEKGFEIYNLFGELLEIREEFQPGEEDLVITTGNVGENTVSLNLQVSPPIIKESFEEKRCYNGEKGIYFDLFKSKTYAAVSGKTPFEILEGWGVAVGENVELNEALKTVIEISKVADLGI